MVGRWRSSTNGTVASGIAVIPTGTIIPAKGSFLITNNPDAATGPTLTYSLTNVAGSAARNGDGDTGYSLDLPDNGGLALFNTATAANFRRRNRVDSVGFAACSGLFIEGTGLPTIATMTRTGSTASFVKL